MIAFIKGVLYVLAGIAFLALLAGGATLIVTLGLFVGAAAIGIAVLVFLYHWVRYMLRPSSE